MKEVKLTNKESVLNYWDTPEMRYKEKLRFWLLAALIFGFMGGFIFALIILPK